MIAIVDSAIDVAAVLVGAGQDGGTEHSNGGVVTFLGAVRSETRGRRVRRLEYEAYGDMALQEMEKVALEARTRYPVLSLDIVHRVGTLQVGDIAVLIVARAAHRAAAFDACRFAIDRLKETVPIWKKEVFEDGEHWVGDRP